jgi:hypothetical protein
MDLGTGAETEREKLDPGGCDLVDEILLSAAMTGAAKGIPLILKKLDLVAIYDSKM